MINTAKFKPFNKKVDKKRISDFCHRIGVELPDDYQKFLLEYNGGVFETPMYLYIPILDCKVEMEYLYGFDYDIPKGGTNIEKSYSYNFNYDLDGHTLVIGHCKTDTGYLCLMLINLEHHSGVYVCDLFYDEFYFEQSQAEDNLYKVADTFSEFLSKLE